MSPNREPRRDASDAAKSPARNVQTPSLRFSSTLRREYAMSINCNVRSRRKHQQSWPLFQSNQLFMYFPKGGGELWLTITKAANNIVIVTAEATNHLDSSFNSFKHGWNQNHG